MFCVNSVEALTKYYELLKERKDAGKHNLKVATIFSYTANEDDKDANGFIPDELEMGEGKLNANSHTRDKLESYIAHYNSMFSTKFTTRDSQSFYNYYQDIAKRVRNREIDILLVVNMFLTGFDSKALNTMYVDKNLKHHGLIQAYSRTNRILNEQKSQGNIVCFRNLKTATDDAIALFANPNAKEEIFLQPYENYTEQFNEALGKLQMIVPMVDSVNDLETEEDKLAFVKAFRELMRIKNVLSTFSDFSFKDLEMDAQDFEDYKSKYLDIYDEVRTFTQKEKVSILNDVDFELELIHRDEINVTYIVRLLARLVNATDYETRKKEIMNLLGGEATLRSKKELIEKFINENLPHIANSEDVPEAFDQFWTEEQAKAFATICEEEQLEKDKFQGIVEDYLYHGQEPLREKLLETRTGPQPGILERKTIAERIIAKLRDFVETFVEGIGG